MTTLGHFAVWVLEGVFNPRFNMADVFIIMVSSGVAANGQYVRAALVLFLGLAISTFIEKMLGQ